MKSCRDARGCYHARRIHREFVLCKKENEIIKILLLLFIRARIDGINVWCMIDKRKEKKMIAKRNSLNVHKKICLPTIGKSRIDNRAIYFIDPR